MTLNDCGRIANEKWFAIEEIYHETKIISKVIMPDHIHAIIKINSSSGHTQNSLSKIIRSYKSGVKREIRTMGIGIWQVWQRSFHDRIVRTENELNSVKEYIRTNPQNTP